MPLNICGNEAQAFQKSTKAHKGDLAGTALCIKRLNWKTPVPWTTPTTYLQRFRDAVALLCAGQVPSDKLLLDWLDTDNDSFALQEFAIEHGPSWAQGIAVLDAARVLADEPTEGVPHETWKAFKAKAARRRKAAMRKGARAVGERAAAETS